MADAIYCHQCAEANRPARKFCAHCQSPLYLRDNPGYTPRACRQCGLENPSFAKFCRQCSTPLVAHPSKGPDAIIPLALNNPHAIPGEDCPACGSDTELLTQYLDSLKRHNASRRIVSGAVELRTGARIVIPKGMREPRADGTARNVNNLVTCGSGCFLTLLLMGLLPFVLPFLRNNAILVLLIALAVGFFVAFRIKGLILRPYVSQLDRAQARWRRARFCPRCDAVFVPGETVYTSPEFLKDLVWNAAEPAAT